MSDVQRILQRIGQGNSTEAALRATIHSDYGQLESDLAAILQISTVISALLPLDFNPLFTMFAPASPLC